MSTTPETRLVPDNPHESPAASSAAPKRSRLPAFITGLVGLAMGAGFYAMLCGFLVVAFLLDAPGIPTPTEGIFIVAAAFFHCIPLVIWILQRRNLYRVRVWLLWGLAVACWLLMPLSGAIMVVNLGM